MEDRPTCNHIEKTEKRSEVAEEMDRLSREVVDLHNHLDALAAKLEPILREPSLCGEDCAPECSCDTSLGRAIKAERTGITEVIRRVKDLSNRSEVYE